MKRLLLVDDDAVLIRSYRDRLSAHGFQVNTAASGLAAITILRAAQPDVVVLDLMMPDLSGVDVLKFIRSEPRLAATPVVVLTNAYLNDLGRQAASIGIQEALLKAQCNPSVLMACIDEILEPKPGPNEPTQMPGDSTTPPSPPTTASLPPPHRTQRETPSAARPTHAEGPTLRQVGTGELGAKAGEDLLAHAPTICADLRKLFQVVAQQPRNGPEQQMRWQNLYRRVHFLAAAAGLTEYTQLTQTAAVFEALLYVLMKEPARIGPSVLRTLANLVDFVELLFRHAGESVPGSPRSAGVLVVDDDPVSNRLVVSALRAAQLDPYSTDDPLVAWQWATHEHFDLILLDIEMPGLDGFEFCKRLRALPGYELTPVMFVTAHSDFESRAKSSVSGGDDLIAKPILPMELAAKVVMHLVTRQMPA
jgi:CheY-like chemotaxis protein